MPQRSATPISRAVLADCRANPLPLARRFGSWTIAVEELAYRIRAAETGDEPHLKAAIGVTLGSPDGKGRRSGYRAAIQRGELLVLEQYNRRSAEWQICGFVESAWMTRSR
jgi:hypothetical protein